MTTKGTLQLCGDDIVMYLDCGGDYMNLHIIKLKTTGRKWMSICKLGKSE